MAQLLAARDEHAGLLARVPSQPSVGLFGLMRYACLDVLGLNDGTPSVYFRLLLSP
jgi:hypothetical protein